MEHYRSPAAPPLAAASPDGVLVSGGRDRARVDLSGRRWSARRSRGGWWIDRHVSLQVLGGCCRWVSSTRQRRSRRRSHGEVVSSTSRRHRWDGDPPGSMRRLARSAAAVSGVDSLQSTAPWSSCPTVGRRASNVVVRLSPSVGGCWRARTQHLKLSNFVEARLAKSAWLLSTAPDAARRQPLLRRVERHWSLGRRRPKLHVEFVPSAPLQR